ncbi:MAG: hypothetical protein V2A62_05055 [Candidatus Woesearchaeota archaeon]
MFIDLSQPRTEYFRDPSEAEILRQFVPKETPITVADLRRLNTDGKVVVATTSGSLDELLGKQPTTIDSRNTVERIDSLGPDQLLILTENYRLASEEVRETLVYSADNLLLLDSAAVKRSVLGLPEDAPVPKLGKGRKIEARWEPERVLSAAFNHLHAHPELYPETLCAYSWRAQDGHRHVVSLLRSIQGAELKAFQDYVAFKLKPHVMKKEIREGKRVGRYAEELDAEQIQRRQHNLVRYGGYVANHNLQQVLETMETDFCDLIEPERRKKSSKLPTFNFYTGRNVDVPSRGKFREHYTIKYTNIPALRVDDPLAYFLTWETRGNCVCKDKNYRSQRRISEPGVGVPEEFLCSHEIAGLHSLRKIHAQPKNYNGNRVIPFLPFVVPSEAVMDYLEKLRYQTVMVTYDEQTNRFSKRTLNHTEMEVLLWKKVAQEGYETCFSTNPAKFGDPREYLVKFRS